MAARVEAAETAVASLEAAAVAVETRLQQAAAACPAAGQVLAELSALEAEAGITLRDLLGGNVARLAGGKVGLTGSSESGAASTAANELLVVTAAESPAAAELDAALSTIAAAVASPRSVLGHEWLLQAAPAAARGEALAAQVAAALRRAASLQAATDEVLAVYSDLVTLATRVSQLQAQLGSPES